ncbi:MAG: SH3 domain-containing protein [Lachnospiraceae bacterium]|nr:SH3 domain-containing protein [Lachnospiraceae bacterium]
MLPVLAASMVITGTRSTYAYTAVKGTVTCTSGKVRKEAGTDASFAFGVRKDDEVTILDEVKGNDGKKWYRIKIGESTGYIRSDLVNKSKETVKDTSEAKAAGTKAEASKDATGTVIVDLAIMRETASTKGEITMCLKQNAEVKLVEAVTGDDGKTWYSVTCNKGDLSYKGYIRSDLLKASGTVAKATDKSSGDSSETEKKTVVTEPAAGVQVGTVKGEGVNVREAVVDGKVIGRVSEGHSVTVTEQIAASDGNLWYKISFTSNLTPLVGYIRSDFVSGVTPNIKADSNKGDPGGGEEKVTAADEENKDEAKEEKKEEEKKETGKIGAVNGINVNVRKEPVDGQVIAKLSTGSTVTVLGGQEGSDGRKWSKISFRFNGSDQTGYMLADFIKEEENKSDYTDALVGMVKGSGIRVRESAVNGTVVEQLNSGHRLNIKGETTGSDGITWYYVDFTCKGVEKKGYVRSDYVNITSTTESVKPSSDKEFEEAIAELPDGYKTNLRFLHEKYPNWQFEVVDTGLDWNEAIAAECSVGKNLIAKNSISSWKSTEPQAYNWKNNEWYGFDGGTWASASRELISYYMDPRNFLDESGIYQFEKLDSLDYQNEDGIRRIIEGTFLESSFTDTDGTERNYVDTIMEAARNAGISPYHLTTRILQEQGLYGRSQSISGTMSGHEGYFNYFNIGAYATNGRLPVENGLIYAAGEDEQFSRPWNSRYRSICGSAAYVGEKYIKKGQNTLYFEKFNVVNHDNGVYSHQYMSNLQAASSESARMKKAYTDTNSILVFRIPYYYNMPDTPCEKPTSESNPNNYLASINVEGLSMAPEFNAATNTYYITVDNSVESINVSATAVASTSSIGGTGDIPLEVGTNTVAIVCKAQNGNTRTYTLYVQRN